MAVASGVAAFGNLGGDNINENVEYNPDKEKHRKQVLQLRIMQARTSVGVRKSNSIQYEESVSSGSEDLNSEEENDPYFLRRKELRSEIKRKSLLQKKKLKISIEQRLLKIQNQKKDLLINDVFMAIFGIIGLIVAQIDYDHFFSDEGKERYEETEKGTILRIFSTIMTILTILLSIRHYFLTYLNHKNSGRLIFNVPFWKSHFFKYMILEFLILSIHNLPNINKIIVLKNQKRYTRYSINAFILLFMTIRIYLILRLIARFTKWRTDQADLICQIEGFQANTAFAMKCLIKENPYQILLFISIFASVVLGIAVRISELPYYVDEFEFEGKIIKKFSEDQQYYQDYSFLWNGWWLVMVTMTTVGFGDFYPVTYFGRTFIFIACYTGTFLVSMTMVSLNKSKDFSFMEGKSFVLLNRLTVRKTVNRLAGLSVLNFLRQSRSKNKFKKDPNNPIHQSDIMMIDEVLERLIERFKIERSALTPEEVPQEEKIRLILEKVEGDIQRIGIELIENQKCYNAIENLLKTQAEAKQQLKAQFVNFKKLEVMIGRLEFASKFGSLKSISITKQIQEQEQEVQEIKQAQREKSEVLKRFKPIKQQDIHKIISEVSDNGDKMQADDIKIKLNKIQNVLLGLEEEEEKASEYLSKSGQNSGRNSSKTNTVVNRPMRVQSQFQIREQTDESFSENDEDYIGQRTMKSQKSAGLYTTEINRNLLLEFTMNSKQRHQYFIDNSSQNRGFSFSEHPSQYQQMNTEYDISPMSIQKLKLLPNQIAMPKDQVQSQPQLNSQQKYLQQMKSQQPFMIQQNVKQKTNPNQINQKSLDQDFLIKRDNRFSKSQTRESGHQKQIVKRGERPQYIEKQFDEQKKRLNSSTPQRNQPSQYKTTQIGNFVNYFHDRQQQESNLYDQMIKNLSIYGVQNEQNIGNYQTKFKVRPTTVEQQERQNSRSPIAAFNKALRQYLKAPQS